MLRGALRLGSRCAQRCCAAPAPARPVSAAAGGGFSGWGDIAPDSEGGGERPPARSAPPPGDDDGFDAPPAREPRTFSPRRPVSREGSGYGSRPSYGGERGGERGGSYERRGPPEPRPGDWPCPSCGFNNFASRGDCFKCQARGWGGAGGQNRAAALPPPVAR